MIALATIICVLFVAILGTGAAGYFLADQGVRVDLWLTVEVIAFLAAALIYFTFGTVPGKLMAIAQTTYRETIRRALFWLLLIFFACLMVLSAFIPYFTFGEDLKMMKDVELDMILLPTLILTIFTASISISEEVEERTTIALLSKPVSRRQFLLGKFVGILASALLMALILTLVMGWTIHFKYDLDRSLERPGDPQEITSMEQALSFLPGMAVGALKYILAIFHEIQAVAPGVVLILCQVMILTAVAVALATRLPMVVNLVICLTVFFVGRLTHVLKAQSADQPLVNFMAQVFGTVLPGLNYYDVGPAIVSDVTVPWGGYVAQAALHGVIYTAIALLFGLILFEDQDLS
jgi:ABC-type transport system involved in multi-copper enzyme maturation permease subunit